MRTSTTWTSKRRTGKTRTVKTRTGQFPYIFTVRALNKTQAQNRLMKHADKMVYL